MFEIKTLGCFHNIDLLEHQKAFETLKIHKKNWEATHQSMHTFTTSNQSIHGLNDFSHYVWLNEHLQSRSHISHILLTIQPATSFSVSFLWSQYSKKLFLNHWDNELTLLQINDWQAKSLHWEALLSIKLYWTVGCILYKPHYLWTIPLTMVKGCCYDTRKSRYPEWLVNEFHSFCSQNQPVILKNASAGSDLDWPLFILHFCDVFCIK